MGVHDGHRARLRERYLKEGLDSFNEINTLELLLFYAIPRRDTNEIAHALLDKFGSLDAVFNATHEDLCAVPGISDGTALLLRLITDLQRKSILSRERPKIVSSTQEAGEYLAPYFIGRRDEAIYLLCLDAKGKVLDCRRLFEGTAHAVAISVRKVVEAAMSSNASVVVLAHNHTSGLAFISQEDISATRRIRSALDNLEIMLLDHLIFSENDFISLAESGAMPTEDEK